MDSSSRLLLCLGLSFTALTASVVYLLLKKDEETEHISDIRSSRRTVIKVKVPNDFIALVIGRGGSTVKSIQEKTGARVHCNDESSTEKYRVVTIQGSPESAQLAESMIHEIITHQPLAITHEMWVPARACGRIIGKGGETIRAITRTSCAKIIVDSSGNNEQSTDRRVLLKGTAEQIEIAKSLIEEKVIEDADLRMRVEMSIANRSPRREPKDNFNYLMAPTHDEDVQTSSQRTERLDSDGREGFFDVFVSALENPSQFWVQLVSQKGVELDQLVDKMTEYYCNPENQKLHFLQEINVGQIVAAPFDHDDKWYRAEILKIEEDEYDPAESRVTLYYGDYGDSSIVRRKDILDLRTDFLSLYFQAIECVLAHVKPSGDEWSDEASNLFEELAQVAQWRKKMAHVVTYRDGTLKRGQRAGSPVPVIELHDMEKGINIGDELVKQGLAVWENPSPTQEAEEVNSNGVRGPIKSTNDSAAKSSQDLMSDLKKPTPINMTPAAVFGPESSNLKMDSGTSAASSSFISKERGQSHGFKFTPKTLDRPGRMQQSHAKVERIVLPEHFSSDDEDGFVLE